MRDALLVALGGATGSVLRWWLSGLVQRGSHAGVFPWGTLAVNIAGSLAIGVIGALGMGRVPLPSPARLLLITGLLGGFTTFSALSIETLTLLKHGQTAAAAAYAFGSLLAGVGAAWVGWSIAARV